MKLINKLFLIMAGLIVMIPAEATDLITVFQQALQSDPTFQAEGKRQLSERENIPIARSFLFPQLFLSTGTSLYNIQDNKTRPLNSLLVDNPAIIAAFNQGKFKYNSNAYTVNLVQPIFNYEAWATFRQAKTSVKAANAQYAAAVQNLIVRTASAYFGVLLAEDELLYTQAEKKAVSEQLDNTLQRYKVGLVPITGVYQAQAQYDRMVAQEIEAKNNIVNAKENLRAITGIYYEQLDGLKPDMPLLSPIPEEVDRWVDLGRRLNWSLQAAYFQSQIAKQQIGIESSGHLPVINAVGQHNVSRTGSTPSGKINNELSSIGVQLELPLFQGGLVMAETKQAKYHYGEALDHQEAVLRSVMNLTHQSYNNIINGISKIKADQQAIISGESALHSTIDGYKVGTQTMLDVLQAQQDLFNTFRVYARDQYDYLSATMALKNAAGTLSIHDIENINQLLTSHEETFSYIRTQQLKASGFEANQVTKSDKAKQKNGA